MHFIHSYKIGRWGLHSAPVGGYYKVKFYGKGGTAMRARLFAFTLALGALLCAAPSAAALDAQPEAAPDTPAVETQAETTDPAPSPDLPDELAPAGVSEEVPILPEKPPTMISSTTPEEIGFVWEEVIREEQPLPDGLTHPEDDPAPSDDTTAASTAPADAASTAPTLPQTGTTGWMVSLLMTAGFALLAGGWFASRKQYAPKH